MVGVKVRHKAMRFLFISRKKGLEILYELGRKIRYIIRYSICKYKVHFI